MLIQGPPTETMKRLKQLIDEEKPSILISVGDVVSKNMMENGIQPKVLIVDNKVMRKRIKPIQVKVDQTLYLKNLPGTLNDEAWNVVRRALNKEEMTRVLVDGEEDLVTLVAVLCAPENALVVYGQPHEGIVAVRVTDQKKEHVRQIVEAMKQDDERLK
ncbi:MAG: GTP-dependent dephospho-CoA kinase family protein [Candidatus Bathyarchaeia archaeon]